MRRLCVLIAALLLPLAAAAQDDAAAIRRVIEEQMSAFQRDDAAAEFEYAAPGIRAQFGDAETFLRMVREGYRPVYRPREVAFAPLETRDGTVIQQVRVIGPDGTPALAIYIMEQQPDGTWRIAGCYLLASDEKVT